MECFKQADETKCSKEYFDNENIIFKVYTKHCQWLLIVKNYIMNLKCICLCNSFVSWLTKISQNGIFLSIFLFMTAIVTHCRQNLFQQDFKNCRLFPQHSIVKDYIYGETDLLHIDILNSDLSFVVYYAPWDHDSIQFKSVFYKAAVHFYEQINFASINCWYPEGKCKKTEGLLKYPYVVLYARLPSNKKAINVQYTGPLLLPNVHRFLKRALKPITYVANKAELEELELLYQVIILGCFNDKVPSDFYNFYYASLILLQFPYMTDVTYAATYNTSLCGGRSELKLISWNRTITYPRTPQYQTKEIVHFVHRNVFLMPMWLPVHEYRSNSLSKLAAKGPLMIVFMPDDPYNLANDAYLTLRSVVLEYTNCKNDSKIQKQIENLPGLAGRIMKYTKDLCSKFAKEAVQNSSTNSFIYTESRCTGQYAKENDSNQCHMYGINEFCLLEEDLWSGKDGAGQFSLLRNIEYYYRSSLSKKNNLTQSIASCKRYLKSTPTVGPVKDENVALAIKSFMEDECGKPHYNSSLKQVNLARSQRNISGLSCSTNKTLSFVALNSVQKSDFYLNNVQSSEFNVWIIDSNSEVLYYMQDDLSRDNLVTFIYNYTHGFLNRKHISSVTNVSSMPKDSLVIVELNAENYLNVTQEMDKSVIVLHYASYCGACKSIGSIYLECKKLFRSISEVTFARIDVSKNSLPWHLTFAQLPQIIFHPLRKKAETEVFDTTGDLNTRSLLLFLLTKLDATTRLKFASDQKISTH